jgi:hypothetical protein
MTHIGRNLTLAAVSRLALAPSVWRNLPYQNLATNTCNRDRPLHKIHAAPRSTTPRHLNPTQPNPTQTTPSPSNRQVEIAFLTLWHTTNHYPSTVQSPSLNAAIQRLVVETDQITPAHQTPSDPIQTTRGLRHSNANLARLLVCACE